MQMANVLVNREFLSAGKEFNRNVSNWGRLGLNLIWIRRHVGSRRSTLMSRSFTLSGEKIISNCLDIKLEFYYLFQHKSADHVILVILILHALR